MVIRLEHDLDTQFKKGLRAIIRSDRLTCEQKMEHLKFNIGINLPFDIPLNFELNDILYDANLDCLERLNKFYAIVR